MKTRKINKIGTALAIVLVISLFIPTMMFAKSAEAIDIGVRDALEIFKAQRRTEPLNQAVGMLVFLKFTRSVLDLAANMVKELC